MKTKRRRSSYTLCEELEHWIGMELNRRKVGKLRHATKNEILNDWGLAWANYLRQCYPNLYPPPHLAHRSIAVEVKAVDPANEERLNELIEKGMGVSFQKMP